MAVFKRLKKSSQRKRGGIQLSQSFRTGQSLSRKHRHVASERDEIRELVRRRRMIARLLVVAGLAVIITMIIINQTIHNQTVVLVAVGDSYDADRYNRIADDYFRQHPVERFKPQLKIDNLNNFFRTVAPEIESLQDIENNLFRSSIMRFTVRRPVAMWEMGNKKYYVDQKGVAFLVNYFTDPEISVVDKSGVSDNESSRQMINNQFLSFVGQIVALAPEKNLKIEQIVIPPLTTRQLEVFFSGVPYLIKMTTTSSPVKQIEDAASVIKYLNQNSIVPNYADVRVERKAYYK